MRQQLPNFKYKFHDLRATFGMNWVDHVMGKDGGKAEYMFARDQLRKLMWHRSATVTDRYLEYRQHIQRLEKAQAGWNRDLVNLIQSV